MDMHGSALTGKRSTAKRPPCGPLGAERVFAEKISGAVTDRKALGRAMVALGSGTFCWSLGCIGSLGQPGTF
jgi:hypothetical protein